MTKEDKELLEKALWAYGNHELRIDLVGEKYLLSGIKIDSFGSDYFLIHDFRNEEFWSGDSTKYVKPLLYDISCLTEEITHPVTGEKVIFCDLFADDVAYLYHGNNETPSNVEVINFVMSEYEIDSLPYFFVEKMKEHHINYMLPDHLFIDKRTLK